MKTIFLFLILCVFPAGIFAQETLTGVRKIDEFGTVYCDDFQAHMDIAVIIGRNNPGSKVYVHFYEGKRTITHWDKKFEKSEKFLVNPMRGGFSDFFSGVRKNARFLKSDISNFVVLDGGFRELMTVEIWLVPAGAEPPKFTPTVDEKSIRYRKGREGYFSHLCDVT